MGRIQFLPSGDVLKYNIALSDSNRRKVEQVAQALNMKLKEKSQGNNAQYELSRSKLQKNLEQIIQKQTKSKNKNILKYLKLKL
ncbi:hypothetical protein MK079_02345 [Candidatus Gracilibacteria bacterium]|nr:hypothetical protein [Candidatus Gracilibacteria bacterium]